MSQTIHAQVDLKDCNDNFDRMLKRFLKKSYKCGVLRLYKDHSMFTKPSQIRHNKKRTKQHKSSFSH